MNEKVTLAEFSFTATINAPIERLIFRRGFLGCQMMNIRDALMLMLLLVQLTRLMADGWQSLRAVRKTCILQMKSMDQHLHILFNYRELLGLLPA